MLVLLFQENGIPLGAALPGCPAQPPKGELLFQQRARQVWWLPEPDYGANTTQRSPARQIGGGHWWRDLPAHFLIFYPAKIVVDVFIIHISVKNFSFGT